MTNFCLKNRKFFCEIAWKIKIFRKFAFKNWNSFTRIHDHPHISNQIDAADLPWSLSIQLVIIKDNIFI